MGVLFPKTIDYIRVTTEYKRGRSQEIETEDTFTGNVQPMSGKEQESMPFGYEDRGQVKVYSNDQLKVAKGGDIQNPGDIVIYQNMKWKLVYELPYQNDLIPHYKYVGVYLETV
jgi:hypothetical protein